MESLIIFVAFLWLLWPFLNNSGGSVLFAILSIILLRKGLSSLSSSVKEAVSLNRKSKGYDTIFNEDSQLPQSFANSDIFEVLGAVGRIELVSNSLQPFALLEKTEKFDVFWLDSSDVRVKTLLLRSKALPETQKALLRVFSNKSHSLQDKESILFRFVAHDSIPAPALLNSFRHGNFLCDLMQFGKPIEEKSRNWQHKKAELLQKLWTFCPPTALTEAYRSIHPLLHQRLSAPLVKHMAIACDTPSEQAIYDHFTFALPTLQLRLEELPLFCIRLIWHQMLLHKCRMAEYCSTIGGIGLLNL